MTYCCIGPGTTVKAYAPAARRRAGHRNFTAFWGGRRPKPPQNRGGLWYNRDTFQKTARPPQAGAQKGRGAACPPSTVLNSVLILGRGGFGTQLAELLVQSGRYGRAVFLDDSAPGCAGTLADLARPGLRAACPGRLCRGGQ